MCVCVCVFFYKSRVCDLLSVFGLSLSGASKSVPSFCPELKHHLTSLLQDMQTPGICIYDPIFGLFLHVGIKQIPYTSKA
jgi:hypothetical protein